MRYGVRSTWTWSTYYVFEEAFLELEKGGGGSVGWFGYTKLFRPQLAMPPFPAWCRVRGPKEKESFRAWHGLILTSETRSLFTNPTTFPIFKFLGHDILRRDMFWAVHRVI